MSFSGEPSSKPQPGVESKAGQLEALQHQVDSLLQELEAKQKNFVIVVADELSIQIVKRLKAEVVNLLAYSPEWHEKLVPQLPAIKADAEIMQSEVRQTLIDFYQDPALWIVSRDETWPSILTRLENAWHHIYLDFNLPYETITSKYDIQTRYGEAFRYSELTDNPVIREALDSYGHTFYEWKNFGRKVRLQEIAQNLWDDA